MAEGILHALAYVAGFIMVIVLTGFCIFAIRLSFINCSGEKIFSNKFWGSALLFVWGVLCLCGAIAFACIPFIKEIG